MCPEETPYLAKGQCIACTEEAKKYFSVEKEECYEGCSEGHLFHPKKYVCRVGYHLTNPKSDNLVSQKGSYDEWKPMIEDQLKTLEGAEYCPDAKPYFMNGECISCGDDKPYFDIDSDSCVECGRGRSYNGDNRKCEAYYEDGTSLKRMVANII